MFENLLLKNIAVLIFIYTIIWYILTSFINIYIAHFICIVLQTIYLMFSLFIFYIKIISRKAMYY